MPDYSLEVCPFPYILHLCTTIPRLYFKAWIYIQHSLTGVSTHYTFIMGTDNKANSCPKNNLQLSWPGILLLWTLLISQTLPAVILILVLYSPSYCDAYSLVLLVCTWVNFLPSKRSLLPRQLLLHNPGSFALIFKYPQCPIQPLCPLIS